MTRDVIGSKWVCRECGHSRGAELVRLAMSREDRDRALAVRELAGYEVLVIFGRSGSTVEYPRPTDQR